MAHKFSDGWDQYASSDLLRMWTQTYGTFDFRYFVSVGGGRRGGNAFVKRCDVGAYQALGRTLSPTGANFYAGTAFKGSGASWGNLFTVDGFGANSINLVSANAGALDVRANHMLAIRNAYYTHLAVSINNNGTMYVLCGNANSSGGGGLQGQDRISAIYGPTDNALLYDQYYYIELEGLIDPTAGSFNLVVNGDTWLDGTGVQTQAAGASSVAAWQEIAIGCNLSNSGAADFYYDDLYVADADLSDPFNQWAQLVGDIAVPYSNVFQDGATLNWTPLGGGAHYVEVDEIPPDLDTSYNSSIVAGNIDTFLKQAVPIAGKSVIALVPIYLVRRVSGGNTSSAAVIRDAGTNFSGSQNGSGTAIGNTSTYTYDWWSVTQRPSNALQGLTDVNVDAMETGYEKVT